MGELSESVIFRHFTKPLVVIKCPWWLLMAPDGYKTQ